MDIQGGFNATGTFHGRILMAVAKHFNFKNEDDLKNYVDFVIHEPVAWLSGLPTDYVNNIGKPKTAFVKLMKTESVRAVLGAEYCDAARQAVWDAYKTIMKHSDEEGNGEENNAGADEEGTIDQMITNVILPTLEIGEGDFPDANSIHSVKAPREQKTNKNKNREAVLAAALRGFIEAESANHPGLGFVALTLLDAYLA
jgi:hypothetical protein